MSMMDLDFQNIVGWGGVSADSSIAVRQMPQIRTEWEPSIDIWIKKKDLEILILGMRTYSTVQPATVPRIGE